MEDRNSKIEATKTIMNWRAPQKAPFRLSFPNQILHEQPFVIQNSYNDNNFYEWNINGKSKYEIIKTNDHG